MASNGEWCGNCGSFVPLGKDDAEAVCQSMPERGRWLRHRNEILVTVATALKACGICAYRCEIKESIGIPCDEFWRMNDTL